MVTPERVLDKTILTAASGSWGLRSGWNKNPLCGLSVLSEAGGDTCSLTYPQSKAGTISIAEGLRG